MKHQFTAIKDIDRRSGDIYISAKAGEKLELSPREAEAAAGFDELEYVGPMTETEGETEVVAQTTEETYDSLMKLKRDELVDKAAALGIAVNSDKKDELAKAILAKKDELALGNGLETDLPAKLEISDSEVTE